MKKGIRRLLNKNGLTLVEILVVLIVASVLLLCATGMLSPVNNLLNTVKSNAHMDAMCNSANEFIRGSLEKAEDISIILYPEKNASPDIKSAAEAKMANQWNIYSAKYKASDGYRLKAIGVMINYNGDFRLYDFGDVTEIEYEWGWDSANQLQISSSANNGGAFTTLINDRDGAGRIHNGWDGHEFHWFDAFNEDFYSNGASGNLNYSYQLAFESKSQSLGDGSISSNYLRICSQIFKRKGNLYSTNVDEQILSYEPANQMKTLSFKLLNGTANISSLSDTSINNIVDIDGIKTIDISSGMNGVVMLYVVRDINTYIKP